MKTPHLVSASAALFILIAALIIGTTYAQALEQRYLYALISRSIATNSKGSALQKIAFRQPDLLMIYGSSEISLKVPGFEASDVFKQYPTGFAVFEVAHSGVTSLLIAQQLASVGADLQGKKVVISFTPQMFQNKMVNSRWYDGLFSPLYANELIFSTQLDFAVKHATAQRMLHYSTTLADQPVLNFALQALARNTLLDRAAYYAIWPLGKLQTIIIELQDHWNILDYLARHPQLQPDVPRQVRPINWSALQTTARRYEVARTTNNPYGILNSTWIDTYHRALPLKPSGSEDTQFINAFQNSFEWADLEILLRILTQLGAQPLLLSRPVNGTAWQAMGVSEAARQVYYDKLQAIAAKYHVPLVDFRNHDSDKLFSVDTASHTSALGWVYVDQTLDAFYHGTLR